MTIEETNIILNVLSNTFDSHDFICEYIFRFPSSYGELLIKHNSATRTNAEIANFLRTNYADLHIIKIGERTSYDIFGNLAECALWEKVSL